MQSKNNPGSWILPLPWQLAGVVLTAGVLGYVSHALFFKLQLPQQFQSFYPYLVFLAVVCFYSLDHFHDELKFGRTQKIYRASLSANIVFAAVSALAGAYIFFQNLELWNFTSLLFPLLLTAGYVVLIAFFKANLYGFKEIIIAVVVAMVLLYPAAGVIGLAEVSLEFALLVLVCLQNLMVFDFFEKDKDDFYGFSTLYKGFSIQNARRFTLCMLVLLTLLMGLVFWFSDGRLYGVFACSAAYFAMFFGSKYFQKFRIYRFVADAVLLLIAL